MPAGRSVLFCSAIVLLLGSHTHAFFTSPLLTHDIAPSRASCIAQHAAGAKCSVGGAQEDGVSRRDALKLAVTGLVPAVVGMPLSPAFAADAEEPEAPDAPASKPREVTYKVDGDLCEKHPTWKQCKNKKLSAKTPPVKMENGLTYQELVVGKGNVPAKGDTCTVHYSLYYNGDEIESSRESSGLAASPLGFQYGASKGAGSVIPALSQGIENMHVGGIRKITAPPELAFGDKGKKPRIPPGATVEFDVQLLTVKRAGTNPIANQGKGAEKNTGLFDLF
eukprot:CAMPEP_0181325188 /NCGR_PEP_ID=MMETSP1101-20121128/20785_1 /TAXON_ID=46948 /ORGANISM="Rhodomonas abbreviata, Strain Caron Lab Isolate" /LENGTH=278 /DNA_ID=CAMNT_0023433465 /DNA_START=24 /DNA_END=860 /DNA_ORIENTATION=-